VVAVVSCAAIVRRRSYCVQLLHSLELGFDGSGAADGGFLALMSHSKLSGFGQVTVSVTPPQEVLSLDLSKMLQ
jgi:hypothetical protein